MSKELDSYVAMRKAFKERCEKDLSSKKILVEATIAKIYSDGWTTDIEIKTIDNEEPIELLVGQDMIHFTDWQPIETMTQEQIRVIGATKNIVVGDIYYGQGGIRFGDMLNPGYIEERQEKKWRYTQGDNAVSAHMQPTHWMPLPDLPK